MKIRLTQDHPRYARLTKDILVDAEPVANPSELMRVKDFAAFENGALVQGWELILPQEEVEALLTRVSAALSTSLGSAAQAYKYVAPARSEQRLTTSTAEDVPLRVQCRFGHVSGALE
jgi:hypothetical protein